MTYIVKIYSLTQSLTPYKQAREPCKKVHLRSSDDNYESE